MGCDYCKFKNKDYNETEAILVRVMNNLINGKMSVPEYSSLMNNIDNSKFIDSSLSSHSSDSKDKDNLDLTFKEELFDFNGDSDEYVENKLHTYENLKKYNQFVFNLIVRCFDDSKEANKILKYLLANNKNSKLLIEYYFNNEINKINYINYRNFYKELNKTSNNHNNNEIIINLNSYLTLEDKTCFSSILQTFSLLTEDAIIEYEDKNITSKGELLYTIFFKRLKTSIVKRINKKLKKNKTNTSIFSNKLFSPLSKKADYYDNRKITMSSNKTCFLYNNMTKKLSITSLNKNEKKCNRFNSNNNDNNFNFLININIISDNNPQQQQFNIQSSIFNNEMKREIINESKEELNYNINTEHINIKDNQEILNKNVKISLLESHLKPKKAATKSYTENNNNNRFANRSISSEDDFSCLNSKKLLNTNFFDSLKQFKNIGSNTNTNNIKYNSNNSNLNANTICSISNFNSTLTKTNKNEDLKTLNYLTPTTANTVNISNNKKCFSCSKGSYLSTDKQINFMNSNIKNNDNMNINTENIYNNSNTPNINSNILIPSLKKSKSKNSNLRSNKFKNKNNKKTTFLEEFTLKTNTPPTISNTTSHLNYLKAFQQKIDEKEERNCEIYEQETMKEEIKEIYNKRRKSILSAISRISQSKSNNTVQETYNNNNSQNIYCNKNYRLHVTNALHTLLKQFFWYYCEVNVNMIIKLIKVLIHKLESIKMVNKEYNRNIKDSLYNSDDDKEESCNERGKSTTKTSYLYSNIEINLSYINDFYELVKNGFSKTSAVLLYEKIITNFFSCLDISRSRNTSSKTKKECYDCDFGEYCYKDYVYAFNNISEFLYIENIIIWYCKGLKQRK